MLKVDNNKCIGCGQCVSTCEEVFDFNDEGYVEVINQDYQDYEDSIEEAINNCPVEAISKE